LKVTIEGEERISRGIAFHIAGAEQRKQRKLKSMLDGVETRYCWSEERESKQFGIGKEVKQGSEGSVKRELYRLLRPA
jgi:hypothetical protein